MRMPTFFLLVALAGCHARQGAVLAPGPTTLPPPPLIPLPAAFAYSADEWAPNAATIQALADPATADYAQLQSLGVALSITSGPAESYRLRVDARGASIAAADSAGLFYALQTLRQLVEAGTPVRGITVDDAPRFSYRGLHLDVSRHFMPVDFVKRYIDLLARHKLNRFHWHLTDDQGWRIQINKHPRLTEVGGCRKETMVARNFNPYVGDNTRHCGFYTQNEIRDVIAYAAQRHVTIIPEIEMPGHAKAALAAYPNLACTPGPFEVRTTWGVEEDVFCPSEETFAFLDDVLTEVAALFPGPYIHIGGDEVPKTRWRQSALAQQIMRRDNLPNEEALQSWFIRRVERMVNAKGKRMIGWDEILEGGLAPNATVMSWRGAAGGIAAARENHDVVMSPNSHLYFDYYQGDPQHEPLNIGGLVTLEKVYAFEPVPDSLTVEQARHILGAQANVWTEYLKTPALVEYMAYPRALALAEVVWSPRAARSWESFMARLPYALRSLDRLRVNYRLPDVAGLAGDRLTLDNAVTISLSTAVPAAVIRYTTDGTDPTTSSTPYRAPFTIPVTPRGVRVTARAFAPDNRTSAPRAATFTRTTLFAAATVDPARLSPGARYEYYEVEARTVTTLDAAPVVRAGVVHRLARRGDERAERYGIRLSGLLRVPQDGLYEFALTSDDGSTLSIAGTLVVDNDGLHGAEEKTGMIALRRGMHPFVLRYAQAGGGAALSLKMRREDEAWAEVPAASLFHWRPAL
jgi:hexosaminidase